MDWASSGMRIQQIPSNFFYVYWIYKLFSAFLLVDQCLASAIIEQ
jgi:hypothetical protein